MKARAARFLYFSMFAACLAVGVAAQQIPPVGTIDSRVGLKPGPPEA